MSGHDFRPHQKLRLVLHYWGGFVFEPWLSCCLVLPVPLELITASLSLLTGESCYGAGSMLLDIASYDLFNVLINTAFFKPIWHSFTEIASHCTPRRIPLSLRSCVFVRFLEFSKNAFWLLYFKFPKMCTLSRTYHSTLNMVGALINIESMSEIPLHSWQYRQKEIFILSLKAPGSKRFWKPLPKQMAIHLIFWDL